MHPHLGLTIAICTRHRPDDLIHCVSSVAKQKLPANPIEILVMDDGDLTIAHLIRLSEIIQNTPIELRYHKKLQPGLFFSRIESLVVSSYELLLFLDDDVELDADYLTRLVQIYQDDADISGIGGMDRLIEPAGIAWSLFGRFFLYSSGVTGKLSASGYGGSMSGWLASKQDFVTEFLLGCNMSFRKSALDKLEVVDWLKSYSLGEDIYLSHVARQKGKLIISPQLTVKHNQSAASRDHEEQVAYTEIVNHYHLLVIKNAKARHYIYQLWTACGLFIRAVLKKSLHFRVKGYGRAIGFIVNRLIKTTLSERG
ncbi:glycosyltransferase family 2 protein [Paenibacillus psychroresistens]|nr:glycosyltransferase family 2 protein [Paenibacillus psychroresistens]